MINSLDYAFAKDGVTNDYAPMQQFLTDLGSTGGTGILEPGQYHIADADPTLIVGPGVPSARLSAYGVRITTDPSQPRTALKIQRDLTPGHENTLRKLVIEGLHIDHFGNPSALYGIKIENAFHCVIRDVIIQAGGNGAGPSSNVNYQAICLSQTDPYNGDTASFWNRIENVSIGGGAVKCPAGVVLHGQANATSISKCTFDYVNNGVLYYADAGGNIANSVRIYDNDFEHVDQGIMFASPIMGYTTCVGLVASHNRAEAVGAFFYYRLNKSPTVSPPVMAFNTSIGSNMLYNPNVLTVVSY